MRDLLADTARRLAAARFDTSDGVDTCRAIVDGVLAAVPAASGAGLIVASPRGELSTRASSGPLVDGLDAFQARTGQGPGAEVLPLTPGTATPARVVVPDLTAATRWPDFAARAAADGIHAVLSFGLPRSHPRVAAGALTLYGAEPHAFGATDELVAALVAGQAAIAFAAAQHAGALTRALATRDVIGQAKGILMHRFSVDGQRAFEMLVESSQHANLKLHAVAAWVVDELGDRGRHRDRSAG